MNDVVFTSYAFGPLYVFQQMRLRESILRIYPNANIRFWHNDDGSSMAKCNVPGSKTFHESMYGFKVHCVRNCINDGFKRVIFLDAAMILEEKIDDILENAHKHGVLATKENTNLWEVISDQCLEYTGKDRTYLGQNNMTLVGGSLYIFDFTNPVAIRVFEYWERLERDGLFGSEEDDVRGLLNGHRKDEACMSLALHEYGVEPQDFNTCGYHNLGGGCEKRRFTFYKLHFRRIGKIHDHSLNQSIIPMHGNILDLGCRDFVFADFFRYHEYNVYPVDIGRLDGKYYRIAIGDHDGITFVQNERDPDATHVSERDTGESVPMMTIESFSKMVGVKRWDLIKMDIEGQEYAVLNTAKHPLAAQVTVEFHAHCGQTKEQLDELLDKLSEYYFIYNRDWHEAHSAGFNYWDVLLMAKDDSQCQNN